jgi:hypothetical protein
VCGANPLDGRCNQFRGHADPRGTVLQWVREEELAS